MISRPQHIAHATAPVIQTEGLRLRMQRYGNFAHRQTFYASDRAVWEGGPGADPTDVVIRHDLRRLA